MIDKYTKIVLKDGRRGVVVDMLGPDYIVDVGSSPDDWETILVRSEDILPPSK